MREAHQVARHLGAAIRQGRRRHGLSQSELAEILGVDREYLSGLERGQATQHLVRLAEALEAVGMTLRAVPSTVVARETGPATAEREAR